MGLDCKYGYVSTEFGNISGDEPVVVVRAQDENSIHILERYYEVCVNSKSPIHHLDLIKKDIETFSRWQSKNLTQVPQSESLVSDGSTQESSD